MGGRWMWLSRGNRRGHWNDGTVLYLDHDGKCMNLHIVQNCVDLHLHTHAHQYKLMMSEQDRWIVAMSNPCETVLQFVKHQHWEKPGKGYTGSLSIVSYKYM